MKVATLLIALIPLALATDNSATVNKDVKAAGAETAKLKATLDTIPDDGPITSSEESQLLSENSAIEKDLKNADSSCSSSTAFSKAGSKTLYNTINGLLPSVQATLNDIVAHKTAFSNAGLIPLVCQNLATQKSDIDSLGSCLAKNAAPPYKAKAPALQAKYDSAFTSTESSLGCS